MTTSDNISAIEKALEGAELAKRECVFAAQEARKADGSDTYPSRVLDKASAVIDGLVSTLLAAAREAEALTREIAELREAGEALAAQARSYQRGFSGTLPLGQALNNWDKASTSARTLLNGGSDAQG